MKLHLKEQKSPVVAVYADKPSEDKIPKLLSCSNPSVFFTIRSFQLSGSVPTEPVSWGESQSSHFKEDSVVSSKQGRVDSQGPPQPKSSHPQGCPMVGAPWSSGSHGDWCSLEGQGAP